MRSWLIVLPVITAMIGPAALSQERCLLAEFRPAESIVDDIRPYLVCGMLQGRDGHFTVALNGQATSMRGVQSCDRVRGDAFARANLRLLNEIPDPESRQTFLTSEFEKADQFLRTAARSEDLAVSSEPDAPKCRNGSESNSQ